MNRYIEENIKKFSVVDAAFYFLLKKKVLRHAKKILFIIAIINEQRYVRLVKCDVNNKGSYM